MIQDTTILINTIETINNVDSVLMRHGVLDPRITGELIVTDYCDLILTRPYEDMAVKQELLNTYLEYLGSNDPVSMMVMSETMAALGYSILAYVQSCRLDSGPGIHWDFIRNLNGFSMYGLRIE